MDNSWENLEPSPIEFLHGLLLEKFHEFRRKRTDNIDVEINGLELNSIIAECKTATYEKYKFMNLDKAIPKSAFDNEGMRIGVIGSVNPIEDIKRIIQFEHLGQVIIVRNNQEYAENIPLRPRLEDIEPLLIKPFPEIEPISFVKVKRTNHDRQPSRFGKRK